ncbi:probable G-protein coupled receptor 139 [Plakobranchus ocellatus]|uniref:Probable G-protein coupled receptor 139 n=1 Tax=Plakobranchus ocellatus TaxID=259542 RepID=A0AAV4A282_9GAST|nr:probable G-protein coupled receptor 139 [Plakobranchus ocellatus]
MRNIGNAQERQKKQYCKRKSGSKFYAGDTVLLCNLRRADRKGGKTADVWFGSYEIVRQLPNGTYELANKGVLLKNKASGSNLKPYVKRQFTSLSTPTSPLPAATPTTGNSFSPTTPITYNGSNSPDEDITVAGESGPPEAIFNPTDLT